jgi:hypothetical protein
MPSIAPDEGAALVKQSTRFDDGEPGRRRNWFVRCVRSRLCNGTRRNGPTIERGCRLGGSLPKNSINQSAVLARSWVEPARPHSAGSRCFAPVDAVRSARSAKDRSSSVFEQRRPDRHRRFGGSRLAASHFPRRTLLICEHPTGVFHGVWPSDDGVSVFCFRGLGLGLGLGGGARSALCPASGTTCPTQGADIGRAGSGQDRAATGSLWRSIAAECTCEARDGSTPTAGTDSADGILDRRQARCHRR